MVIGTARQEEMIARNTQEWSTAEPRSLFVLGNGGGGTSLLRGILNAHSRLHIEFEKSGTHEDWQKMANAHCEHNDTVWGNKLPLEQLFNGGWEDDMIADIVLNHRVIFIQRRFSRYYKGKAKPTYQTNWRRAQEVYWAMRELKPHRILVVSFEELLLAPAREMKRACEFIGVEYEPEMLKGTRETGHNQYKHDGFLLAKV